MYASPQEFVGLANAGATGLFRGYFEAFKISLPRL
jgi:hypothetical protein